MVVGGGDGGGSVDGDGVDEDVDGGGQDMNETLKIDVSLVRVEQ